MLTQEKRIIMWLDNEYGEGNDNVKLVKSALEKRIPKKPIGRHTSYKCPECDRRVRSGKGSSCRGIDYFCQRCGQALDWGDTE